MMRNLALLLALALFLAPTASALNATKVTAGHLACIGNATQLVLDPTTGMPTVIVAVIGLTVVVIAAAYMIGNVFSNANYIVFAKDELYHLGFSLAILAGFSGILLFSCNSIDMFYSSTFDSLGTLPSGCFHETTTMQGVAKCYMRIAKGDVTHVAEYYIDNYLSKLMDSTFSWSLQIPLMNSYTSTAGSYKRVLSNQFDIILNSFLIPALMSISMQKLALDFITENLITWVLPSAFIFRLFIPTRQMGDMLIALVLGVYILVPFMYVFNFAMYDVLLTSDDCAMFQDAVCDFALNGTDCSGACADTNSFWAVARFIPQAFFLPNLTIAVLITFLSGIHKALRVIG